MVVVEDPRPLPGRGQEGEQLRVMLQAIMPSVGVSSRVIFISGFVGLVEVGMGRESILELELITRCVSLLILLLCLCVLIEGLLVTRLQELVVHLLVVPTELRLLPLFELLLRVLIIFIHVLPSVLLFLLLSLLRPLLVLSLIHPKKIFFGKRITLALGLQATIRFLKLLEFLL